jgi:hypothetical protein
VTIFVQGITPPGKATNPVPEMNAVSITIDSNLSWVAGIGASSHLVYFGTDNPPSFQKEQDGNLYDPNNLMTYDCNYFWQINESGPNGITTGDIWKFRTTTSPIPPSNPVAANINATAYNWITNTIELSATDDGEPNSPGQLSYIITSLPENALLQDPCSGNFIDGNMLPYSLSFYGNLVYFATESNSTPRTFYYKANDGNQPDGNSNVATVTVTVSEYPHTLLSFDGLGVVEFNDNNAYDINNGWAVDFWVRTREPFVGLLNKRDANQGWEIGLTSGKPKIYIYDNNATVVAEARSFYRVDDGQWHELGFNFNQDPCSIQLMIQTKYSHEPVVVVGEFQVSFQNDCNLQLGFNSKQGYRGDLDMLRFFNGITDPTGSGAIIQGFYMMDGSGFESWMGVGKESAVRYQLQEGSGTLITDDKQGLTGTLQDPNHVRWYPFWWPYQDVSFLLRRNP